MKTIETFAEYFCLNSDRDNFFIDEARDWQLVFGSRKYKEGVDVMLDQAIATKRPPRLVWVGDFGVGKTHHINYTYNRILDEKLPFHVIKMETPDLEDNSEFNILFQRMINEIGFKFFKEHLVAHISKQAGWLDAITPIDIRKALRQLALNEEVAELAWKFICGKALAKDERAQVGVSKLQIDDSEEFASVMKAIAQVIRFQSKDKKTLIYLIDEVEGLLAITKPNAVNLWTNALRKILDIDEVGAIFAIGSQDLNAIPPIMMQGPIIRRFGQQNYVQISTYEFTEACGFLKGLFLSFVDPAKRAALETAEGFTSKADYDSATYPFMANALEGYCQYLVSESGRSKPAQFLLALNTTLNAAMREGKKVVDRAFLELRGEWQ
jgi:hypothetical protein